MDRLIPVEDLQKGEKLVLPRDRVVDVQRVDSYAVRRGDPMRVIVAAEGDVELIYYVRWASGGTYGPGHPLAGQRHSLGSLKPLRAGDLVTVDG